MLKTVQIPLTFSVSLRVKSLGISTPMTSYDPLERLMMAVNRLENHAGYSNLRMVTFGSSVYNPFSPILSQSLKHRLQLFTSPTDAWGPRGYQNFELNHEQWKRLVSSADQIEWIRLLHHLVTRSSERAFFEVHDRLNSSYGVQRDSLDEGIWIKPCRWDSEPPRRIEDLLMARLRPIRVDDKEALHGGGDKILRLELPCGHEISIRKIEVLALTSGACAVQQCPACGQRILLAADNKEIIMGREHERVRLCKKTKTNWQTLDQKVPASSGLETFSTARLLQALSASLESFNAPALICPPPLCPVNFEETRLVMKHFEKFYDATAHSVTLSQLDLLESLYGLAVSTRSGSDNVSIAKTEMPRGWTVFLAQWLTRTVNFLTDRQCFKKHSQHAALHEHDDGLYYNARDMLSDVHSSSVDEIRHRREMQNVEAMMEDVDLIG